MNPIIDLANEATFIDLLVPQSVATNNTASAGVQVNNFLGRPVLVIDIGLSTAGTTPGITVYVQQSATNNASNATNFTGIAGFSNFAFPSSNNAAAVKAVLPIDIRAIDTFLFVRCVLTGTNSPAFPVHAQLIGTEKTQ